MRLRILANPLALAAIWLSLVVAGFVGLMCYATAPGETAASPERWPSDSLVTPDSSRANLVLVLHPRCSCSQATIAQLEQLIARCDGLLSVHVLFSRPTGVEEGWERTDLWERAAALPGVNLFADENGAEARRFGAATSGQALLFDRSGTLRFRGGITNMRGHAGDSAGSEAIYSLLHHAAAARPETPVFGCPLFDQRSTDRDGERPCCK